MADEGERRRESLFEQRHHFLGCAFAVEVIRALGLSQDVVLSSLNLYHRFFFRKDLQKYDNISIAMACTLLGAKLENQTQVVRDLVNAFHKCYLEHKNLPYFELELGGELYSLWKQELVDLECEVLKELGFACYEDRDLPHYYALDVLRACGLEETAKTLTISANEPISLAQFVLNLLNDAMFSSLVVRYDALYIAASAVLIAVQQFSLSAETIRPDLLRRLRLDPEIVAAIERELSALHSVPTLSAQETASCDERILFNPSSGVIRWMEPLAEVPFLKITSERALSQRSASFR